MSYLSGAILAVLIMAVLIGISRADESCDGTLVKGVVLYECIETKP